MATTIAMRIMFPPNTSRIGSIARPLGEVGFVKYIIAVWYEEHFDIRDAIQRENSLKRWPRQWKIELIEKTNPEWFELFRGTGW
ncbi:MULTISPECIES: hypothetical protein [unclassified Mesorhizobium]|uniref:hypothetical protein n=1 Tax=unclassified Mesorhizobium TaxID=325217 RepID=UPI00333B3EC5